MQRTRRYIVHHAVRYVGLATTLAALAIAGTAAADTVSVHGVLHATGGGAAPDGGARPLGADFDIGAFER